MNIRLLGRFDCVRTLGEGGSGTVHLVHDSFAGGEQLALKKMPLNAVEQAVAEFKKLCAFQHPGLPQAREIGLDPEDGSLFIASEYRDGVDFLGALRGQPLPLQVEACAELLRTLAFLHDHGIVHRDLKPQNVLVHRDGADLRVSVIDLGLATGIAQQTAVAGSLPYLAPELFEGARPTPASDLYALGILLFELWVGRHPFPAQRVLDWVRSHQHRIPAFPDGFALPTPLVRFVLKLLEKQPGNRFVDARVALLDLARSAPSRVAVDNRRSLLGRVRSFPYGSLHDGPVRGDPATSATTLTWIHGATRGHRRRRMLESRAEAVLHRMQPLVVAFDVLTDDPDGLLRTLHLQSGGTGELDAGDFEEVFAALGADTIVYLEEVHRRSREAEHWIRRLLRMKLPLVVSSENSPAHDASLLKMIEGSGRKLVDCAPARVDRAALQVLLPKWLGVGYSEELGRFLGIGSGLDVDVMVETLTDLVDSGAVEIENGALLMRGSAATAVPCNLTAVFEQRLRRLEPGMQDLLLAVSVLGEQATVELVEAISALRPALGRMIRLCDEGFLERASTRGGDRYRMTAGAIESALGSATTSERRTQLHAAAARLLEQRGAPRIEVARHAFRAQPDAVAGKVLCEEADLLLESGRIAEVLALASLVLDTTGLPEPLLAHARYLKGVVESKHGSNAEAENLLRLASTHCDEQLRPRLVAELARTLEKAGRLKESLELLEGLDLSDAAAAPILVQKAMILHRLELDDLALEVCAQAAAGLPDTPNYPRMRLHNTLGLIHSHRFEAANARREFGVAIDYARHFGNPILLGNLQHNLARIEDDQGHLESALQLFQTARHTMMEFGDEHTARTAATAVAQTLFVLGRLDDAKIELEAFRRDLDRIQVSPVFSRYLAMTEAQIALEEGDLEVALEQAQRAVEIAKGQGDVRGELLAEVVRLEILTRSGKAESARELLARLDHSVANGSFSAEVGEYLSIAGRRFAAWLGTEVERQLWVQTRESVSKNRPAAQAAHRAAGARRPSGAEEGEAASRGRRGGGSASPTSKETQSLSNSCSGSESPSVRRSIDLSEGRMRLFWLLERFDEARAECAENLQRLDATDLVDRRALAGAMLVEFELRALGRAAPGGVDEARRQLQSVVCAGHRMRKAEAAFFLGQATSDSLLLEEALEMARRGRHAPLIAEVEAALRKSRVAQRQDSGYQAERRLRSLEQMIGVAKLLSRQIDGDQLLRTVLDHALERTHARRGFLILVKGDTIAIPVARNIELADIANPHIAVSTSVARRVALEGRSMLFSDASADARLRNASSISELKLQSILCVPLRGPEGEVVGALYLDDPTRVDCFQEEDMKYLEDLSEYAAIALEKARLIRANVDRQRALERSKRENERLNRALREALATQTEELAKVKDSLQKSRAQRILKYEYPLLVSRSKAMNEVLRVIDRLTDSSYPVFLFGESGTGKELLARSIHFNGPRSPREFFSINCASMPAGLIESELFGHVKGAFTGADRDRAGVFELANEGTLFLDEIADAAPELQSRLLRAVQFGEILRVGSEQPLKVDVRVISAANRDLQKEVEAGRFRQDLFFRLSVHRVEVPPLKDRPEDIALLVDHFLTLHAEKLQMQRPTFQKAALERLTVYHWPGNVRELENCIIDLLVRGTPGQPVDETDLPDKLLRSAASVDPALLQLGFRDALADLEKALIQQALRASGGVRSKAAQALGMSERNLYKKLRKLGLAGDDPTLPAD